MRCLIIMLLVAVALPVLLLITAAPAGADPANQNTLQLTLTCPGAPPIQAVFELSSSDSFHLVSTSSNFLWKSLMYVTPSGQTGEIDRGIEGGGHAQLVTCMYIGPASGNSYTVTGFFTP